MLGSTEGSTLAHAWTTCVNNIEPRSSTILLPGCRFVIGFVIRTVEERAYFCSVSTAFILFCSWCWFWIMWSALGNGEREGRVNNIVVIGAGNKKVIWPGECVPYKWSRANTIQNGPTNFTSKRLLRFALCRPDPIRRRLPTALNWTNPRWKANGKIRKFSLFSMYCGLDVDIILVGDKIVGFILSGSKAR